LTTACSNRIREPTQNTKADNFSIILYIWLSLKQNQGKNSLQEIISKSVQHCWHGNGYYLLSIQ